MLFRTVLLSNVGSPFAARGGPPKRSGVALLVVALLVALGCSQRVEGGGEDLRKEAPKELPGKVVKRAPLGATDPAAPEKGTAEKGTAEKGTADGPSESAQDDSEASEGAGGYRFLSIGEVSDDPDVRREIAALSKAGNAKTVMDKLVRDKARSVPALRLALRHRDQNVRIQAADVLARLSEPSPETSAAFTAALQRDPNQEVRAAVARALTQYEDPTVVPVLLAAIEGDSYGMVRANAAWALGAQESVAGDARRDAVDGLAKALGDKETWVRLRSLSAIKRLRGTKALPAVVERVKDENSVVRERAVQTLQKLTGKKFGEDYEKWKRAVR